MKTKQILLIAVVVAILGALQFANRGRVQGFQNPSEPTFTMYQADWCPHCVNAKPGFQELIEKGRPGCKIQMVSPEKEPEKAAGKPVKGFPTFLLELPDGTFKEYQGSRDVAGYMAFLNQELGGGV